MSDPGHSLWYHCGITGSMIPPAYSQPDHGDVLVVFDEIPPTGYEYILTSNGYVFRSLDGGPWLKYFEVMQWSVPAHVASIRNAPYQRVLSDNYTGPVPKRASEVTPARPVPQETAEPHPGRADVTPEKRSKRVTKTKTAPAPKKEPASADKPQRLGARAKKLLEMELGLTRDQQTDVHTKADALSRERVLPNGKPDTLTRVWDIYEAAGKKLPDNIAAERDEFMKTGVLKRSGNGGGTAKAERAGKNEDSPAPKQPTSPKQSPTPEPVSVPDTPDTASAGDGSTETPGSQTSGSSPEETETL